MMPPQSKQVAIRNDMDIVTARSTARDVARGLGFGSIDQARIATAVSELARNVFVHGKGGYMNVTELERNGRRGIELEFVDQGPGIGNLDQALQDGFSTVGSMGMGMPGAKRLMDEFDIQSTLGVGTTIMCRKWRN
jgi:serine/threonine-protein kinase RsbT